MNAWNWDVEYINQILTGALNIVRGVLQILAILAKVPLKNVERSFVYQDIFAS